MESCSFWNIFKKSCENNPSNNCFIWNDADGEQREVYTYQQVYNASNYLYDKFNMLFESGEAIGVLMKHEVMLLATMAMIHKHSCPFVLLDPHKNLKHQKSLLMKANVKYVISNLNEMSVENWEIIENAQLENRLVNLFKFVGQNEATKNKYSNIAYFIQTTGTTSLPKCVAVTHDSIFPNIKDFQTLLDVSSEDVILFSTPLTFDPVFVEIYLAIINGACLLSIQPAFPILKPNMKDKPTIIQTTPSKLFLNDEESIKSMLSESDIILKAIILGGEPFTCFDKLKRLKSAKNTTRIFNVYGITEVSCWASIEEINFNENSYELNIGLPLSDTIVKIEKDPGLERGYIMIGSSNRRCFIDEEILKYSDKYERSLIFRNTGDIGEELSNKKIKFLCRKDFIIKRLGHKVNLKKIETFGLSMEMINQCACFWIDETQKIILLFTSEANNSKNILKQHLIRSLEAFELPDEIHQVNILPLNTHGKMSYSKALDIYNEIINARHEGMMEFYTSLQNLLNLDDRNETTIRQSSFIELGGNSILALQFANSLLPQNNKEYFNIIKMLLNRDDCIANVHTYFNNLPRESLKKRSLVAKSGGSYKKPKIEKKYTMCIRWSHDLGKCIDASPTLCRKNGVEHLAIGSHSGKFSVINIDSGEISFSIECDSRIECTATAFTRESDDSNLCFGDYDGNIRCLSLSDNSLLWKKSIGSKVKSKPCYYNSKLYVGAYDSHLYRIDCKTGDIENKMKVGKSGISADLLLGDEGSIFTASLDGTLCRVDCDSFRKKWEKTLSSPVFASPVFDRDRIIVIEVKGILHSFEAETGSEIWKSADVGGSIFSTPAVRDVDGLRRVIFGGDDGRLRIFRREDPARLRRIDFRARIAAGVRPFGDRDAVFATTAGTVAIVDSLSGAVRGSLSLPGEIFSTPLVVRNVVCVGCRDDRVRAIEVRES